MTNASIDNSADSDFKKVITWQYDNATKLVAVVQMFKDFFDQSTKNLWNGIGSGIDIESAQTINPYYLAIWGKILGVKRPTIAYQTAPLQRPMSDSLYRKILIARFRLVNSAPTVDSYLTFVKYVFGNNVRVDYRSDMSIGFTFTKTSGLTADELEQSLVIQQFPDVVFAYPTGVKSSVQSQSPVFGFFDQLTMVLNGEIVSEQTVTSVAVNIKNDTDDVVNSVQITANVTNSYSRTRTLSVGFKIQIDGEWYIMDSSSSITLPAHTSSTVPSSTPVTFSKTGDGNPTVGSTSKIYNSSGTVQQSSYLNATVASFTKNETHSRVITIPVGAYITASGVNYATDVSTSLNKQQTKNITFKTITATIPSFTTATVKDSGGNTITDITATFSSTEQYSGYPAGSVPSVLTAVRVYATLSGTSAMIPNGAKTTVGGVQFFTKSQKVLSQTDNSFVMVAIGNHPVSSGSITNVVASDDSAISGVTGYTNQKVSSTDFSIETLDNCSFSWTRKNV